jgi:RimJ/RimL family protein N-acetyltransferase
MNLVCRRILECDFELLWEWRNNPDVLKYTTSKQPIPISEHLKWCKARTLEKRIELEPFMTYLDSNQIIGFARLDLLQDDTFEVSLVIGSEYRNHGYGKEVLSNICTSARVMRRNVAITARIHQENVASKNLFLNCGFVLIENGSEFDLYVLSAY